MIHEESVGLDAWDRTSAGLRAAAFLAGIAYCFQPFGPPSRPELLWCFCAFAGYSVLLYLAGWRLLHTQAKGTFYGVAAVLDLALVVTLMLLTGADRSPFYRALYLWVAMLAFYFGRRGGLFSAVAAAAVVAAFHVHGGFVVRGWTLALQAGGLLLHGPLIGYMTDRGGRRIEALREVSGKLADATRQIREDRVMLAQAEQLSSIGLLAAGVAHEINNPLSGVMGCIKALREGTVRESSREQYFSTVWDGLERIRITVQSLLDYARPRPPAPSAIDVAEILSASLSLVADAVKKKNVHVETGVAPDESRGWADKRQVVQALVNILLNAVHAVAEGGHVVVDAAVRDGQIGIRIADDGPGIPAQVLARVCEPFFTTKPQGEGTGLGLAITAGVANANGGDLTIESDEGRGTTVTLWLPAAGNEPPDA